MKKLLALFLALSMILTFAACSEDPTEAPDAGSSVPSSGTPSSSVPESTGGSENTSQPPASAPGTSEAPETQPPVTNPPATETHTHSYASTVITAATCSKEGVKTFTCSCGDTYTEKIAATGQHSWGSWKTENCALVNRKGTDKRTCSTCSAAETRENTESVLGNSFYDPGLEHIFYWGFNMDGSPRTYALLQYAPYRYDKFAYKVNSTDTIYDTLAKSFVLNNAVKDEMRAQGREYEYWGYDEANDTFTFEGLSMGSVGYAEPLGYIHNGGNQYTVYYRFEENGGSDAQIYKVVLEFNRTDCFDVMSWKLNGEENKYLSFEKVSSVPSNLTK